MFAILESVIYNVIGDGKCVHKTEISGSQSSDQTYLIFLKIVKSGGLKHAI